MGCLIILLSMISVRLTIIILWIFTNLVDRAYDTFLVPLLGLIFLPWTTLFYVLCWSPKDGVTGIGWFFVILGFLFDLGSMARGRVEQTRRGAATA